MKKLICIALALVMVLGLAITASAADQVTLVMAEVNPLDTIVGKTDAFFAEKVEELTPGSALIVNKAGLLQVSDVLGEKDNRRCSCERI